MPTAAGTSPVSKPSSALPSKGRAHFRLLAKAPSVFGMPDTEAKRSKKEQVWANARATSLIGSPSINRLTVSPRAVQSRSVKTTERYDTGPEWIASMPCSAVASNSNVSPAPTSTDFAPYR